MCVVTVNVSHKAVNPESQTPGVLAYKVTKVTSDSWPDKEATTGTERV